MKPLLFDETELDFTSHGFGPIATATRCVVTEEANGAFELQMTLPITDPRFPDLAYRRQILAPPNPYDRAQPFRIYRVSRPLRGAVTVFARHVSYDLLGVVIGPFEASTAGLACAAINNNPLSPTLFTFNTDIVKSGDMSVTVPTAARALLGPEERENTLLYLYGGEFKFDRFDVLLLQSRGVDRGFKINYGVNMTELRADGNAAEVYTGILPYWTDGETVVRGETQYASGSFPYSIIKPVDLSGEFAEKPTVAEVEAHGAEYITRNRIGEPNESFQVSFVPPGSRGLKTIEDLRLFDPVTVRYEALGVDVKRQVVKTTWDVLRERYESVEIGERRLYVPEIIAAPVTANKLAPGSVGGGSLSKGVKADIKDAKDTAADAKDSASAANTLASTANSTANTAKDRADNAYSLASTAKDEADGAVNSLVLLRNQIRNSSSFEDLKEKV